MSRTCTICKHKKRHQIDRDLVDSVSYRRIASKYGVGEKSVERHHKAGHVNKSIQDAHDAGEIEAGKDLQARIDEIYSLSLEAAKQAKHEDLRAFGSCLSPAVKVLEIISKGPSEQNNGKYSKTNQSIDERLESLARRRAERKAAADR